MNLRTDLVAVDREAFYAFVEKHRLVADGFHKNGSFNQSSWRDSDGVEQARSSADGFGHVYEIAPVKEAAHADA